MSIKAMTKAWELDLKSTDKLVLLALADHANDDFECYPSLRKICEKCGLTKQGLIKSMNRLIEFGYISKEGRNRTDGSSSSNLYTLHLEVVNHVDGRVNEVDGVVNNVYPPSKPRLQGVVNHVYPYNHNIKPSIETSNNLQLDNTSNFAYTLSLEAISYLNSMAGTNYKSNTKKTLSLIKARLNEGFTLDDFKTVIEKKVMLWKNDLKMQAYLRPETLFGTKFESYLNEIVSNGRVMAVTGIISDKTAKGFNVMDEWLEDKRNA